jgi:hypothetical protein
LPRHDELANKLREIELYIATDWSGQLYSTAFGTELLVADSNRGETLLTERTFSAPFALDRLKDWGKAVAKVQYPILLSSSRIIGLSHFCKVVAKSRKNFISVIESEQPSKILSSASSASISADSLSTVSRETSWIWPG